MLDLYRAIEPYPAALGFTALSAGVIFVVLFGAMRWFAGLHRNSASASRRSSTLSNDEIEHLKFQINASMDRADKLHQREFETVPEAWSSLVGAFNSVKSFIS